MRFLLRCLFASHHLPCHFLQPFPRWRYPSASHSLMPFSQCGLSLPPYAPFLSLGRLCQRRPPYRGWGIPRQQWLLGPRMFTCGVTSPTGAHNNLQPALSHSVLLCCCVVVSTCVLPPPARPPKSVVCVPCTHSLAPYHPGGGDKALDFSPFTKIHQAAVLAHFFCLSIAGAGHGTDTLKELNGNNLRCSPPPPPPCRTGVLPRRAAGVQCKVSSSAMSFA